MRSKKATAGRATAQARVHRRAGGRRHGLTPHYDDVPGILVEEPTSRFARNRGRGNLYALVEIDGESEGNDEVADHLAQVISDAYYGERRSVTAGLQQAIREVNTLLHEQNRTTLAAERLTGGVSCVLLRHQDLFIAQAGPAAIYMCHEAQVTRFPELSPWLDNIPQEAVDTAPLGERREVHVDLYHCQASEGDTVLLVNSEMARRASPRVWRGILTAPSPDAVLEALMATGPGQDLSALVLRLGDQPVDQAAVQKPPRKADAQQKRRQAVMVPPPQVNPTPGRAAPVPSVAVPIAEAVLESVEPSPPRIDRAPRTDGATVARVRAMGRALAAVGSGLVVLGKRMMPGPPVRLDIAPPGAMPVLESTVALPRIDPTPVGTATGKKKDEPPRAEPARVQVRGAVLQKALLAVAILIPLLATALVAYSLLQWDQNQDAKVDDLWLEAESLWVQAGAANDPATVRALLVDAQATVNTLLARQPGRADALKLQQEIQQRLDANNQVQRIPWEGRLVTYPSGADLNRVVVEGVHVFVMDRNGGRVYHHQMDEFQQAVDPTTQETVLVQKGDQVGKILVGDLIDMAWMPAGNGRPKAGLLIMESGGSLLQYDPGTKALVSLHTAAGNTWQLPQLMGSHSGRFYLLDSKANKIWRYSPTPDGYSAAPEEWLETAIDLAGVRDMAIGDSIFLLYADGKIRRLTGGEPDAFDIADWDTPPKAPTAIFTRPPTQTQWLYVADPGNNRIVQISTDGRFKRQFRLADSQQTGSSDPLASVTSLFVDEIGGRAYFLSANELHLIMLPE